MTSGILLYMMAQPSKKAACMPKPGLSMQPLVANRLSTDFQMFGLVPSAFGGFFVKQIDLAGIAPFGMLLYFNEFGSDPSVATDPTVDDYIERRQSQSGNTGYPQYNIFVNNPDVDIYPTTVLPTVTITDLKAVCVGNAASATVLYTTNQSGFSSIIVNIDGVPGYDPDAGDVAIEQNSSVPVLCI